MLTDADGCWQVAEEAWAANRVRYFAEPQRGNSPSDAALPEQASLKRALSEPLESLKRALREP
jgi:hypothetical protein